MGKLISSLPMPLDYNAESASELFYSNKANSIKIKDYSFSDSAMKYTKEAPIKTFTIKPGLNHLLTLKQLQKYSSSRLGTKTGVTEKSFALYGCGFRINLKNPSYGGSQTLLDIDLTDTGNIIENGKTYTLSAFLSNVTNGENLKACFSYGQNIHPEVTVSSLTNPTTHFTFTAKMTSSHLYYGFNKWIPATGIDCKFTLYINGLVEGEEPSFMLPSDLGFRPIISSCNETFKSHYTTGLNLGNVNGGYYEDRIGVDACSILNALDKKIYENQDVFKIDWR